MKRSTSEILAWIVQECFEPKVKSRIMSEGNLNSSQVNVYLERLISSGLIVAEEGRFKTTEQGVEFVSCYSRLVGMIRVEVCGVVNEEVLSSFPKCLVSRGSRVVVKSMGAHPTS